MYGEWKRKSAWLAKRGGRYILGFLKWAAAAGLLGGACGALGAGFHGAIDWATGFRQAHPGIIWFLPAAGLCTLLLYKLCRVSFGAGTNLIIQSVTTNVHVPFLLAPLVAVGTVLSHLFGASVGREGAALQLGGSVGHNFGELLRFDGEDVRVLSMCGMAAVFSAMFGTPLAAAVFVLEVIQVGTIHYNAFLPCVIASYASFLVSRLFGAQPMRYSLAGGIPAFSAGSAGRVVVLAALCGVVSIVLCVSLRASAQFMVKLLKNPFLRIGAGGLVLAILAAVFHLYDYAGASAQLIDQAIAGEAASGAFLIKIALTALCVGAGFRGGEIVPTLVIGATFGCVVGPLLGLDPGFAAAVGMMSLFCSVVNCPFATLFLAAEMFSTGDLGLFALGAAASFVLSGYFGLYSSQEFLYSKITRGEKEEHYHEGA